MRTPISTLYTITTKITCMSEPGTKSKHIVLIIGASGFIGRHVVSRLAKQKYHVYATHLPTEVPLAIPGVDWIPCDLAEHDAMSAWPPQCESLIYLAQSPKWRDFPVGAIDVLEINLAAVVRSAEYARQAGVQRFIFASTGSVYDQVAKAACENDPVIVGAPRRFYDATKLAAEVLLGPYSELFAVVVLRLFMPYGSGQDANMLMPQLVRRVRETEPILLHGKDGLIANPVAVSDVAEVLERCLQLRQSATLNVAGPASLTLREIGECIGRVLGISPRFVEQTEQSAPVIVGDTTAMKTIFEWCPQITLESGLRLWLMPQE